MSKPLPTVDLSDNAQGASVGDEQSSLASLASSIVKGVTENGRTYAAYGKEGQSADLSIVEAAKQRTEYGMPMDEQEMDRIDMSHAKYFMLLDKRRFLAPISENPQRVLDLGTGTGSSAYLLRFTWLVRLQLTRYA